MIEYNRIKYLEIVIYSNDLDKINSIPKKYYKDKEFLLYLIPKKIAHHIIEEILHSKEENHLLFDDEIIIELLNKDGNYIKYIKEEIITEKFVEIALNNTIESFKVIPDRFKTNKKFVLKLLKEKDEIKSIFDNLPQDLKTDKDIIEIGLKKNGLILFFLDKKYYKDFNIINLAVNTTPDIIKNIDVEIEHNFKFEEQIKLYETALNKNPLLLEFANYNIKTNKEFILKILDKDINILEFVNYQLLKDILNNDLIFKLIEKDTSIIRFFPKNILSNENIMNIVLEKDINVFKLIGEDLKNSPPFVEKHILKNIDIIKYCGEEIYSTYSIAKKVLEKNGLYLNLFLPELLKENNNELIKIAVKQNGFALKYVSEDLKKDKELCLYAVKQNGAALLETKLQNDREIVLEAIKQNGLAIQYAGNLYKTKEFFELAIETNREVFKYLTFELKNDLEWVNKILTKFPECKNI